MINDRSSDIPSSIRDYQLKQGDLLILESHVCNDRHNFLYLESHSRIVRNEILFKEIHPLAGIFFEKSVSAILGFLINLISLLLDKLLWLVITFSSLLLYSHHQDNCQNYEDHKNRRTQYLRTQPRQNPYEGKTLSNSSTSRFKSNEIHKDLWLNLLRLSSQLLILAQPTISQHMSAPMVSNSFGLLYIFEVYAVSSTL